MIVRDTDVRFSIDPVSGEITNNSEKDTITQGSHNSEVFTFEMPRDIGHDMMNCNLIEVHYLNIKAKDKTERSEGIYKVNDLQVCPEDDKKVILSWTIDGSATVHHGTLSFSIHFKCISDDGKCLYRWPTKTFSKIGITSCVDTTDAVIEDNQDIIAEWEARISALEQSGGGGGGGANVMRVIINDDGVANNTANDIYEHIQGGGVAVLDTGGCFINVSIATDARAIFAEIQDDFVHYAHIIEPDGSYEAVEMAHAKQEDIGNISAALDTIIAMQEELIGT